MNPFRRFLGYLQPYRWWITQAIALMFILSGLGLVMPYIMRLLIDDVLSPEKVSQIAQDSTLYDRAVRNLILLQKKEGSKDERPWYHFREFYTRRSWLSQRFVTMLIRRGLSRTKNP